MRLYRSISPLAAGLAAAFALMAATGCATKNYVRNQTAPLITHTDQLENETAANSNQIRDTDQRAQAGIKQAQGAADAANQSAQNAQKAAGDATAQANQTVHRADSLAGVVKDLDNYKQVADVTVTFGFDKSVLTQDDRAQLDAFAAQLAQAKSYILAVTGGTDTTGPAGYNYALSQRRADAVVQYLASKYSVPAYRIYLIGIGKDQQVAPDNTRAGREKNRRVEVQLLTSVGQAAAAANGAESKL